MHKKVNSLKDKNILLCITGSIAAYKACDIIRCLVKEKANVQVMMSDSAQKFIGIATIAALTKYEVLTNMFPNNPKPGLEHINLSFDLDAVVIAPATANILGKAASGVADEIVSTALSICEQPMLFVPAMNFKMWQNKSIIDAVSLLKKQGKHIMDPITGELASLHKGEGRFPETNDIMNQIRAMFDIYLTLKGKHVIITAGPTQEPIDPVRYLSNRSSGKMGYALATKARDMGAKVILISGPVNLSPIPEVECISIETAKEMNDAVNTYVKNMDYIFMAAAVSDYASHEISNKKLKRSSKDLVLKLTPTIDVLKSIQNNTKAKIIAFALETHDGEKEAMRKLNEKKADYIILNYANEEGAGFESSTNRVIIFDKKGTKHELKKDRKDRIAEKIILHVLETKKKQLTSN